MLYHQGLVTTIRAASGQRREGQNLQDAVAGNNQPLLAQLRCYWSKQDRGQSLRDLRQLTSTLLRFINRDLVEKVECQLLDLGPLRQFMGCDRCWRNCPEKAAILAKF